MGSLPNLNELGPESKRDRWKYFHECDQCKYCGGHESRSPSKTHKQRERRSSQKYSPDFKRDSTIHNNFMDHNGLNRPCVVTDFSRVSGQFSFNPCRPRHRPLLKTYSDYEHPCNNIQERSSTLPFLSMTATLQTKSVRVDINDNTALRSIINMRKSAQESQMSELIHDSNRMRLDSMSSSAGSTSVRKLLNAIRSSPLATDCVIYSRKLLNQNFIALCIGHLVLTATFVPLFSLQGSLSAWYWPSPDITSNVLTNASLYGSPDQLQSVANSIYVNTNIGSALLTLATTISTIAILFSLAIVNKLGLIWTMIFAYAFIASFLTIHFYPSLLLLVIGYALMGFWLGPLAVTRTTFLMTIASKMTYVLTDREEKEVREPHIMSRSEIIIHKLARKFRFSADLGLMLGTIITALILKNADSQIHTSGFNISMPVPFGTLFYNEYGQKVCGSKACPLDPFRMQTESSLIEESTVFPFALSAGTTSLLTGLFVGCGLLAVAISSALLAKIKVEGSKASRDYRSIFQDPKIQLLAPMSLFIGLEQAFISNDFTKFYVACAMELVDIPLVLLSMGVLQSIAAFTLSLLLHHIKRKYIIGVGFVFHSCLLLVLIQWNPSNDDPALFYVISAAWGVCNAIWDTLTFGFIAAVYPNNCQVPFAHSYFFRFLGLALAYGAHGTICNSTKLYVMSGALVFAVIPYAWLEMKMESYDRRRDETSGFWPGSTGPVYWVADSDQRRSYDDRRLPRKQHHQKPRHITRLRRSHKSHHPQTSFDMDP